MPLEVCTGTPEDWQHASFIGIKSSHMLNFLFGKSSDCKFKAEHPFNPKIKLPILVSDELPFGENLDSYVGIGRNFEEKSFSSKFFL